ncbi:hypothetical protein HDU99_010751, partial [Rhizoclosmatium hyalinum]
MLGTNDVNPPNVLNVASPSHSRSQNAPKWRVNTPTRFQAVPTSLELWPVSRVAYEFANDGILSHVWGNDLKLQTISGKGVLLRQDDPTKLELFQHIIESGANDSPRIWVDILDIDQDDMAHKVAQIEELPELYRSKGFTIIYHSEDPESLPGLLAHDLNENNKRDIRIEVMEGMLHSCEHSLRVWTLQETALANRVVHVFRTTDPTMVLVAHKQFKQNCLEALTTLNGPTQLDLLYSLPTWFFRTGDLESDLNVTGLSDEHLMFLRRFVSPQDITKRLPQLRRTTQLLDHVNGRAAIYDMKPISYDASLRLFFTKLIDFGIVYLFGDFPMDVQTKKAIFPTESESLHQIVLNGLQSKYEPRITTMNGSKVVSKSIRLPLLKRDSVFHADYSIIETEIGWALKLVAQIMRPNEDLLRSLFLDQQEVDWWIPENQERRVFIHEGQLCGFKSSGEIQSFSWDMSPFVVPFVAVVKDTVYLVKEMSRNQVVLGKPVGNHILDEEDEVFERDVIVHFV